MRECHKRLSLCSVSDTSLLVTIRKDAAIFIRDYEDLFREKIKSVVLVGGAGGVGRDEFAHARKSNDASRRRSSIGSMLTMAGLGLPEPPFTPDNSEVNQLDERAAKFLFQRCQELGVQLIMVPSEVKGGR